ncbi:MAG TPA: ParA family protein [Actinomycetota bacterium]|nr:ParA family protein [Actinomycetota bacterium]
MIPLPDFRDNAGPVERSPQSRGHSAGDATVLALANQKGGVGKTTTAVNLGACLAEAGFPVLLVDLDPQGNATTGLGLDRSTVKVGTYEVLGGTPVEDAIQSTAVENLSILPSTIDLAGAEVELVSAFARETKLRGGLASIRDRFAFILIDSPPSLGLLTVNALAASDKVLVPIQCEYYALEGLGQLIRTVELVRDGIHPTLDVGGVVLTMFDARTKLAEQVVGEVRAHLGEKVFATIIPRSVRLSEAPGFGQPIIEYDGGSRASGAYRDLAREVIARFRDPAPSGEPPLRQDIPPSEGAHR